jgi:hypothetical protein
MRFLCVVSSGVNEHFPPQNKRLNGLKRNLSAMLDEVVSSDDLGRSSNAGHLLRNVLHGKSEVAPLKTGQLGSPPYFLSATVSAEAASSPLSLLRGVRAGKLRFALLDYQQLQTGN